VTKNGQVFNLEIKNIKDTDVAEALPAAGNTSGMVFFFAGLMILSGGVLMLKKRRRA